MGLSSKQVSSDRHGWNQALLQASTLELPKPSSSSSMKRPSSQVQQQQQQGEPLKCPRCESSNTKFCYYNNYNKSQPRHFCKACKRHWTKGGTLRNVPVGGGRKNKRLKTSTTKPASKTTTSIPTTTTTTTNNDNIKMLIQTNNHQPRFTLPLVGVSSSSSLGVGFDDKTFTEEFYQTLVRQPTTTTTTTTTTLPERSITTFLNNEGLFMNSATQDHHNLHHFSSYSNLGSFDQSNPCSISSYGIEETLINSLNNNNNNNTSLSSSSMSDHHQQQWNATPTTTNSLMMDITSNWGWDDFDKFVTVDADLTMPWDDDDHDDDNSEIKPSSAP